MCKIDCLYHLYKIFYASFVAWLLESLKNHHNCNRRAKELFPDHCNHFQVRLKTFEGVELDEFPELEKYFEVQLFAMFLKEDGSAKSLYLSRASFPTKIYMNVYQNHLSLITDIKMYSKQYICNRCDKVSMKLSYHLRHQSKCDGTVKYVFPGGMYKNKLSVFEELEEWVYGCVRRTNMKSGLRVLILRSISVTLMKRWMLLKKLRWKWKKGRYGIKCMSRCHLV